MHRERSSASKRTQRRGRRRWAAIGGTALAAVLVGGTLSVMLSGRDELRPLAAEASPTPTATVQTPSPTASPSASPATAATPAQTPEPTATPAPTSDGGAWIGPERISTREYGPLSMVVDDDGYAHLAASMGFRHGSPGGDGVWYVTNSSGEWLRERLSSPAEWQWHGQPSIARDSDGSLWVAYVENMETESRGPYLLTNRSGAWTSEELPTCHCSDLSLAVANGIVHLAVQADPMFEAAMHGGDPDPAVSYLTNAGGSWSSELLAKPASGPSIALDSDGRPHIAFFNGEDVNYAEPQAADGQFKLHRGLGASRRVWATAPEVWISRDGTVWYTTDGSEWLEVKQLASSALTGCCSWAAIAVDSHGRPHILLSLIEYFAHGEAGASELWYAIGPGD